MPNYSKEQALLILRGLRKMILPIPTRYKNSEQLLRSGKLREALLEYNPNLTEADINTALPILEIMVLLKRRGGKLRK